MNNQILTLKGIVKNFPGVLANDHIDFFLKRGGLLNRDESEKRIRELSERYNFDINPKDLIKDLPIGMQQKVEIIKTLYREAQVLILDEPTAVLTPQESEELFSILVRDLSSEGRLEQSLLVQHGTFRKEEVLMGPDLGSSNRLIPMRPPHVLGVIHAESAARRIDLWRWPLASAERYRDEIGKVLLGKPLRNIFDA